MTIAEQARNAGLGWLELITARPSPEPRFQATMGGLVVAIAAYLIVVLMRVVLQGLAIGLPNLTAIFFAVLVNALPLLPIWLIAWLTLRLLRPSVKLLALLVPAYWAMAFLWLIGIPLSFISPTLNNAILAMLGVMLFRAGRGIADLGPTLAISYAILSILALVTVALSLYMVLARGEPGPI